MLVTGEFSDLGRGVKRSYVLTQSPRPSSTTLGHEGDQNHSMECTNVVWQLDNVHFSVLKA